MITKRTTAPKQGALSADRIRALHVFRTTNTSIRKCAKTYNVSYSSLQRLTKKTGDTATLNKRGRNTVFTKEEEELMRDSVLSFAHQGTPLSKEGFKDLVQHYILSLPPDRISKLPFMNHRPGNGFVRNFIRRHSQVTFKRRSQLEKPRQMAMSPTNLAKHYARLEQVYKEYKIHSPEQIFNIDESGFSTRTAARSRAKALFDGKGRSNSVELKWSANAEHVTIMPVVSADGRAWAPLAVLPGKQAKYRKRANGSIETPSTFLPPNAYCVYREKAGMDTDIFFQWGQKFVEETTALRRRHRNILLLLDGYGAHVSFNVLRLFRDNRIVVVGLPAHSSHRTQPLDYTVFSPYKTAFRNELNRRTLLVKDSAKNDVYTVCELLTIAYNQAVTSQNIIIGFHACGYWDRRCGGVNSDVIRATDITNYEGAVSQEATFKNYQSLVESFKGSQNMLRSDGEVLVNGTLNTTSGLLLTESRVIDTLEARKREREEAEREKQRRAVEAEKRRLEKEKEAQERQRQREMAALAKEAHEKWLSHRRDRSLLLASNRAARRSVARLRTSSRATATSVTNQLP